jgi:hypothetical protein
MNTESLSQTGLIGTLTRRLSKAVRVLSTALLRLISLPVVLLLALPVAALPVGSGVPAPLQSRVRRARKGAANNAGGCLERILVHNTERMNIK